MTPILARRVEFRLRAEESVGQIGVEQTGNFWQNCPLPRYRGGVPKRSKGADCKSAGNAFGGSNPPPSTNAVRTFFISYGCPREDFKLSKVPVNPFALGAAFVERAVELGWVEVDSDGRRSSYYLTASGSEGLENFGVKIEKAMQFAVLPERSDSAPKRRASSSLQAHRGSMPSHRGPMSPSGGPSHRGSAPHGGSSQGGRHSGPHKGPGRYEPHGRHEGHGRRDAQGRDETRVHHEGHVRHDRHGEPRKRTER